MLFGAAKESTRACPINHYDLREGKGKIYSDGSKYDDYRKSDK